MEEQDNLVMVEVPVHCDEEFLQSPNLNRTSPFKEYRFISKGFIYYSFYFIYLFHSLIANTNRSISILCVFGKGTFYLISNKIDNDIKEGT